MHTTSLLTLLVAAAMAVDLQAGQPQRSHEEAVASTAKTQVRDEAGSGTRKTPRSESERYVSAATLSVRSAGSGAGKVLRKLKQGECVSAYEVRNGWVRISPDKATPEWVIGSSLSSRRC